MINRTGTCLFWILILLFVQMPVSALADDLAVVQAGPEGEIANLEEANEIRVQFSEPMVALGRIPDPVRVPYIRISPPIEGTFRWSGTRLVIFTPAEGVALANCTTYTVTVDGSAASIDGRKLGSPYIFSFTTPTVRLRRADWYRKTKQYDSPAIIALRFNQEVSPKSVVKHLTLRYEPYDWSEPDIPEAVQERLGRESPQAMKDFEKKVEQTIAATKSSSLVRFVLATEWDTEKYPPAPDLVVIETVEVPSVQSRIKIRLDDAIPGVQGTATPEEEQTQVLSMEPAFFVSGLHCSEECSVEFYNALAFTRRLAPKVLLSSLQVLDVTDPAHETPVSPSAQASSQKEEEESEECEDCPDYGYGETPEYQVSLDRLGLPIKPARNYLFKVDKTLRSADGQTLGYTWYGQAQYWHKSAFTSFGTGHGVWEASGGPQLPFYARNLERIKQWVAPVSLEELVPTILKIDGIKLKADGTPIQEGPSDPPPPVPPRFRTIKPEPDVIQTLGLNLKKQLSAGGTGIVWAAIQGEEAIHLAYDSEQEPRATLVQVTNLGISVKDSPQNTLILVTRLDDGRPVEGAAVAIRQLDNKVFWSGVTGPDGTAIAPNTDLRTPLKLDSWEAQYWLSYVVTAQKGEDIAYLCSNWNQGIREYDFNVDYDLDESKPLLRGTVFADRGVYKLGEEVHVKAVLRQDTVKGIAMFEPGTKVQVIVEDTNGQDLCKLDLPISEWGTADFTCTLPAGGPLGAYSIKATVGGIQNAAWGEFLVAAYRKPDFRVDATIGGPEDMAGASLKGLVNARYLFGAPMSGLPVAISYYKRAIQDVPAAIHDKFPVERYAFLKEAWETAPRPERINILAQDATLGPDGTATLDLPTDLQAGYPYAYTIEGNVTDVSRQTIAGSASIPIHPAPWYLGLKRPSFFVTQKDGLKTEVVAVTPSGVVTSGVKATAILSQIQWNSVRHAEGDGFYWWESQRVEVEKWRGEVTTEAAPVPFDVQLPEGGYFLLSVTASDSEGRETTTNTDFYVLGEGYTAWARYDHNRIDLVPEKKSYRPGETARIMVKSPWEKATALVTTEREGIRSHSEFELTSTQQTVEVPLTEADIPNLFISVLLVRGRTGTTIEKNGSDPGKPAFRLGYAELEIQSAGRRLSVAVTSDKEEYRPAETATVSVEVKDAAGKPAMSEVTLWAVDYGVLSLTGYQTPDILDSIYIAKALQVNNADSRQCIISRRVITPKGAEEGGGGGYEEGPANQIRKDFRVLAFWLGSVVTDADGTFTTKTKLPDSLTTYRIMAVVNDKAHRFGWGQSEIRLNKPVLLLPAFPRFLALGDKAYFGAVVHSMLKEKGKALVSIKSLDPGILTFSGPATQTVEVGSNTKTEVRFHAEARSVGTARIRMSVRVKNEEDAFEIGLPVELQASKEVVAAYGTAAPDAAEALELPAGGVVPSIGGLHLEMASTAMVGLGEGARFLVDYPYGCAEQRASAAIALMLTADLGDAFRLPDIKPEDLKKTVQETLKELEEFQCSNGGFTYWKGSSCMYTSAYLTSYVLHVMQRARKLGYAVPDHVMGLAASYLESQLALTGNPKEVQFPAFTSWQAFAAKVLAEAGKNVDSHVTRLYGYKDRMPVFGLCFLWDAMAAAGEKGSRPADIKRRVMNTILAEGGASHVEELTDPYLLWYWNSNIRSTAIALGSLVRNDPADPATTQSIVRWLMQVRKKARWGNTQENAWAMSALVDYYRAFEKEIPDFSGVAKLGLETLMTEAFKGRDTKARMTDTPMQKLAAAAKPGERLPLAFHREGTGTLFYTAQFSYAPAALTLDAFDSGIRIQRRYEPMGGGTPGTTYKAGDLVQVIITLDLTKERRFVAVTDPIPAGFEPVESWFKTTASELTQDQEEEEYGASWVDQWRKGGFDHVERHDDRVLLFATRLAEGQHSYRYVCRATTAGTFRAAPTHGEEMYSPEVFGRTASTVVEVKQ